MPDAGWPIRLSVWQKRKNFNDLMYATNLQYFPNNYYRFVQCAFFAPLFHHDSAVSFFPRYCLKIFYGLESNAKHNQIKLMKFQI